MTHTVITVGRQYGSGGRFVARKLAEKLGIPYYDKELLTIAAKESGICEEMFEDHDEKPTRSLLFSLVTGLQMRGDAGSVYMDMPLNHKIFLAQFGAIRNIAAKGPCVIVGRCADYVLKEHPRCLNFYIYADLQSRVERATTVYDMEKEHAADNIQKLDKKRANYYNFYSNLRWGLAENYDLCVNSASIGVDSTVEVLKSFIERKENVSPK